MNEEIADSGETSETESFNMDGALESIGQDLFPNSETEEVETEETDEVETDEVEAEEVEPETEETEETEEKVERKPPQSWKKDKHELWNSMSDEAKDYYEERESQMKEGLEKDRTDANLGRTMRDIMTPHSQVLKQQGIDEPTAVKYMLNAHYKLSNGTPDQRKAAFQEMAKAYGLNDATTTPEVNDLVSRIQNIESNLTASQQRSLQEMRGSIESTVDAFAKDHPYFDDLSDDIAKFIHAGYELEDAYEKAKWSNPATRQKEIDREQKEKSEKLSIVKKAETDKAKKAKSVNVRGRDTGKTHTAPTGTMEDTLRETMRSIKSRN